MNLTHLEHTVVAILIQLIYGILTDDWCIGAVAAIFFFIGREHSQAEDRWIYKFSIKGREGAPFYCGLDPRVWYKEYDAILDWIIPSIVVITIAYFLDNDRFMLLVNTFLKNIYLHTL